MSKVNKSILPEDKDVTQKVLTGFDFSKSMESDIDNVDNELDDRQVDFEEFEGFISDRLSQISSWNSRAESTAEDLVEGEVTFDDAFSIIEIPSDKDRYAISHGESADLNRVLSRSQLLIGQLSIMLKIAVDSLEYAEDAVDVQKSQKIQKETIKILQDNMGTVIDNTVEQSVGRVVQESLDEVRNSERLKKRIDELEDKVDNQDGFDKEAVIADVREEIDFDESADQDVDLEEVIKNSDVSSKKDLGIVLKSSTELDRNQIAGILDSSPDTVSQWKVDEK